MLSSIIYSMRIPSYNGEGDHNFVMWVVKLRAYLASQSLTPILSPMFKDSLPDAETLSVGYERKGNRCADHGA